MFPYILPSICMSVRFNSFITRKVMEFQKELSMWLEDVTLFSNATAKPDDAVTQGLEDFVIDGGNGKTIDQPGFLDFNDVSDIVEGECWLDEKIDLSVFDLMQDWLLSPADDDNSAKLEDTLPPAMMKSSEDSEKLLNLSPSIIDFKCENVNVEENLYAIASSSPASILSGDTGQQLPSSPYSHSSNIYSPISSDEEELSDSSSAVQTDCVTFDQPPSKVVCFEIVPEIESFLDNKTSPPSGKDLSLLRQSRKARSKPYSASNKKEFRRERKKVQNKEAAARYRTKKRQQDKVLAGDIAALETTRSELQTKHDKLKSEVTYLKSLMKELFKARGILK